MTILVGVFLFMAGWFVSLCHRGDCKIDAGVHLVLQGLACIALWCAIGAMAFAFFTKS